MGTHPPYGPSWSPQGVREKTRLRLGSYHRSVHGASPSDPCHEEKDRPLRPSRPCPHRPKAHCCRKTDGQHPILHGPCFLRATHPARSYQLYQDWCPWPHEAQESLMNTASRSSFAKGVRMIMRDFNTTKYEFYDCEWELLPPFPY